jgi:DNA mismatch repair ATPase MutS
VQQILHLLAKNTFQGEAAFFSHWGNISLAYRLMSERRDEFIRAYSALGTVDFIVSIAELLNASTDRAPYCFAEYSFEPIISMNACWGPLLDPATAVTNDIQCDLIRSLIITGPNARGKTTVLRNVGGSALLALTLGLGTARTITISQNLNLLTAINVRDDLANGLSLFEASVKRMAMILHTAQADNRPTLIIVDEPFVGTNQQVALAIARRILPSMAQRANVLLLLTSHLPLNDIEPQLFAHYYVAEGHRLAEGRYDNAEYNDQAINIIERHLGEGPDADAIRRNLASAAHKNAERGTNN